MRLELTFHLDLYVYRNATLRENITFGDPDVDEARFEEAVRSCALEPDIAMRESRSEPPDPLYLRLTSDYDSQSLMVSRPRSESEASTLVEARRREFVSLEPSTPIATSAYSTIRSVPSPYTLEDDDSR